METSRLEIAKTKKLWKGEKVYFSQLYIHHTHEDWSTIASPNTKYKQKNLYKIIF